VSPDRSRRAGRRCLSCGSRLGPGARQCAICGQLVPRRLTLPGVAAESLFAVLTVAVVAAGLLWLRGRGGPFVSQRESTARIEVIARQPTDVATLTPLPRPSPTRPPNTPRPPTPTPLPRTLIHVVVSGDTLFGIAAQYSVTGDSIIEANADVMDSPHRLSIGQELRIPISGPDSPELAQAPAPEDHPAEAAAGASARTGEGERVAAKDETAPGEALVPMADPVTYSVQAGDTITTVAGVVGLPAEELVRLNSEKLANAEVALLPGDELVVRVAEPVTTSRRVRPPSLGLVDSMDVRSGGAAVPPPEELAQEDYPAPMPLAPGDLVTVTSEAPLLRWSSAGVLPAGVFYVVVVREAGDPEARPHLEWVTSNATAVRVPAGFRPALGSTRAIEWSVSVRRRMVRLLGSAEGVMLSPSPEWREFTWAPGR